MIYLNYAACSPAHPQAERECKEAISAFGENLYSEEGIQWYRKKIKKYRRMVADLLHVTHSSSIAFVPNASTANVLLLSLVNWQPGDIILSSTHENPSIRNELLALKFRGIETVFLPLTSSARQFTLSVHKALSQHKVRAIIISHVSHVDGRIFPITEITTLAEEHHALCIVDGAQAVGHIEVNFENLNCDAYVFSGYKWCCGPLGTGGMVIAKRLLDFAPALLSNPHIENELDASRFEIGTQNIGLIAGFAKACDIKEQEGFKTEALKEIREEAKSILAKRQGIQLREWDGPHAPGILTFECQDHDNLMKRYRKEQVVVKEFVDYPENETPAIRMSWQSNLDADSMKQAVNAIAP